MSSDRRPSAVTISLSADDASSDDTGEANAAHGLGALLRRASSASHQRRTLMLTKSKSKPTLVPTMTSREPSISTEEFEALPSSIQRKYFSSEERLAIAQHSAAEKRQRQSSKKSASTIPASRSTVFDALPKRRKTFQRRPSKHKQHRSSLPSVWNVDLSLAASDDPTWFDSLPDKVKRSQFSKQEIEALDARKEHEIERPRTSSGCKPVFDTITWSSFSKVKQTALSHSPSVSVSPSTCSNQTSQSAPQMPPSHSPLSSSPAASNHRNERGGPASPGVPALTVTTPSETKRPSLRRPFILQPIQLPAPTLAPASSLPSPDTTGYIDTIKMLGHVDPRKWDEDITPTQEREDARLDVRGRPPAWYDEKLDFNFDSSDTHKSSLSTYTSGHTRTVSPSISDAASLDTSGPITPISPATLPHAFDQPISRMPPLPRPSSAGNISDGVAYNSSITNFSHPQSASRESPRLKPTRQAPRHLIDGFYEDQQNQPYSITIHYNKDDPLALEALPVCDDLTGAHGAFAVADEHHASGLRKVLKVIRGH